MPPLQEAGTAWSPALQSLLRALDVQGETLLTRQWWQLPRPLAASLSHSAAIAAAGLRLLAVEALPDCRLQPAQDGGLAGLIPTATDPCI